MRTTIHHILLILVQPAKFGGDKLFGSEDIMVLVSLVILEDHVIKGMCKSPPTKVTIQLSLVALEIPVLQI